jgi:hypothetical protein
MMARRPTGAPLATAGHGLGARPSASVDSSLARELSLAELQNHRAPQQLPRPIKNPPLLPLTALGPEVFERVVAEMVSMQGSPTVHFYGRSGQRQHGLDIYEEQADGTRILYQVKKYAEMTCAHIRQAVADYAGPPRQSSDGLPARRFSPQRFVVVTSAPVDDDTAKVDLVAELQIRYRGDLQIAVWGAEAVSRRLRASPNLVSAVFGESWAREYCGSSNLLRAQKEARNRTRIEHVLRAATAGQYATDNEVRFRQVELSGVAVESLFVDVPVSSSPGSDTEELLKQVNPQGQPEWNRRRSDSASTAAGDRSAIIAQAGAAQTLLHPRWAGSAVIVGGPGQGKTTLLQFLCQFHRARVLGRDEYSPIAADLEPVSAVVRTPIRVELAEYAAWRRERLGQKGKQPYVGNTTVRPGRRGAPVPEVSLESFIAQVVAEAAAQPFTAKDLAAAVTSRPMLIALDGLDEVADSDERDQVADEIRALQSRLSANRRDIQVLVATRPGSVGRPIWRDPHFAMLSLSQLTPALRMKYLERWTQQSKLPPEEVDELKETFTKSITLPHVVELAGNPMQLAILLHLMQRRAVLPEKRTNLYERYIDVFMDRESKFALVAQNKDLILAFHKLLAWHIHTQVELGRSKGTVTLKELKMLLVEYLMPRGRDTAFIDELFEAVTARVLCLVQRDLDSREFQFEVQPLREYFAAEHLFDRLPNNTPKNTRPAGLDILLRRPYWSNVMRFFAGKFTSGEVPAMIYVLRTMQQDGQIGAHPISRAAAKLLLDDQVLAGQVELVIKDIVHVVLDGPGPVLAVDGLLQQDDMLPRFQEHSGAKQAVEVLMAALSSDDTVIADSAAQLLAHFGALPHAAKSWWAAIGIIHPARWLTTAAALHALRGLKSEQEKDLAALVDSLEPDVPILDLLVRSRSDALHERIVARCVDELKRGQIDLTGQTDTDSPYGCLATAFSATNFYDCLRLSGDSQGSLPSSLLGRPAAGPPDGVRPRRRVRSRSTSALWNAYVGALQSAHAQDNDWTAAHTWHQLFDTVAQTWSADCWPIREALLAMPTHAYPAGPDAADINQGASWRSLARWHADANEHRGDLTWWRNESQRCADPLATMTFVVVALTAARSNVVQDLTNELDTHIAGLDRRRWAGASAALFRCRQLRPGLRELNVSDALRTRQMRPSGRLAVLIWHVGRDSTRTQLCHFLASDLAILWNAGPSVGLVLQYLLRVHGQPFVIEKLRGSRPDLPQGTLRDAKLKAMTYPQAQEILRNPQHWPTDIVRIAADHLSTRLAKQMPVSTVAAENGWNI